MLDGGQYSDFVEGVVLLLVRESQHLDLLQSIDLRVRLPQSQVHTAVGALTYKNATNKIRYSGKERRVCPYQVS